jgi:hypothetical protein
MIYPFKCDCGEHIEVIRMSKDAHLPEICKCGKEMTRIFTVPLFAIDKIAEYFDHALGCTIKSKADKDNAIKRLKDGKVNGRDVLMTDEKGKKYIEKADVPGVNLVEVGNEKPKLAPNRQEY